MGNNWDKQEVSCSVDIFLTVCCRIWNLLSLSTRLLINLNKTGQKISSKSVILMDSTSSKWPNIFSWIIESPASDVLFSERWSIRHLLLLPSNQELILIHEEARENSDWDIFDRSSWSYFQICQCQETGNILGTFQIKKKKRKPGCNTWSWNNHCGNQKNTNPCLCIMCWWCSNAKILCYGYII